MSFAEQLDQFDRIARPPAEKLREALAMYDEGLALQGQTLRRRYPHLSAEELDAMLSTWLLREQSP